ncbi:MAG TPA: hypothetical protein PL091_12465, partial [Actinomycetota bacterium]|nr:hypothetical protein [Actinomycetota bacterium]
MRISARFSAVVAAAALTVGLVGCSAEVSVGGDSSESPSAEQSAPLDVQTYTSDKYGFSFQYAPPFEQK